MSSFAQDAPSDLQEHWRLTARARYPIDRPINKDNESFPLRWQFRGLRDGERRALLFTNVIGAGGESYDIPVLGWARRFSRDLCDPVGVPVEDIGRVWVKAMAEPIAPVLVEDALRQKSSTGAEIQKSDCESSCADLDAWLRSRALSHRNIVRNRTPTTTSRT